MMLRAALVVKRQRHTQALLLRDFVLNGKTEPSGSVVTVAAGYLILFGMQALVASLLVVQPLLGALLPGDT